MEVENFILIVKFSLIYPKCPNPCNDLNDSEYVKSEIIHEP